MRHNVWTNLLSWVHFGGPAEEGDDPQPRGLSPGRQRDLQQNTKDNIQA